MVAGLFFGCHLNTSFLFPTLCNGRERSAPEDALEEEEEEEEEEDEEEEEEEQEDDDEEDEEPDNLSVLGAGVGAVVAREGAQLRPLHPRHPSHECGSPSPQPKC